MKIDKNKRQTIAVAQKVTSVIADRLKSAKPDKSAEAKVVLTKIAQDLADRREKVLKGQVKGE